MSQSFPRSSRILNGRQYQRVFRNNQRLSDRYWTVLAHRHDKPEARLGLAIAKKRAKRAVDRNRLKRVARESFRYHRASLEGFDVVVMNRDSAATASSAQLHAALEHQWKKLMKQATQSQ